MVYADAAALGGSSLIVDNRENTQLLLLRTTTLLRLDMIFFIKKNLRWDGFLFFLSSFLRCFVLSYLGLPW